MHADMINIALAFIEGFVLIVSPCILPVLPIILSGSLTGSKSRPLGIVTGFIIIFACFTLFSRLLIQFTTINLNMVRNVSLAILLLLGIIMMSKTLTEKFTLWTQPLTNVGGSLQTANNTQGGFWSGFLFGGLVGIIWTPCAGPVLAAVIVQVILQQTTVNSILVVFAFALGVGIPMLLIALFSRNIVAYFGFIRERAGLIRQLLGVVITVTVIYLLFFQGFVFSFNKHGKVVITHSHSLVNGIEQPYSAPAISGITAWINSPPLNWDELKGKVVLVDFWTYSCINCIRTLPYLKDWYAKYHAKGFEIIGVHSPEFQFEHDVGNVKYAVKINEITYPVGLDNAFVTWRNFQNQYWPAHYLVNQEGKVVYVHFGEGEYDVTENNIRFLLGMDKAEPENKADDIYEVNLTPETYLGYRRMENFKGVAGIVKDISAHYIYPDYIANDEWSLSGSWLISSEKIISMGKDAAIKLHFRGKNVYAVMGVTEKPVTIKLRLNDSPLTVNAGKDVKNSEVIVNHHQLYSLVNLTEKGEGTLEMMASDKGLEMYTFTFGN